MAVCADVTSFADAAVSADVAVSAVRRMPSTICSASEACVFACAAWLFSSSSSQICVFACAAGSCANVIVLYLKGCQHLSEGQSTAGHVAVGVLGSICVAVWGLERRWLDQLCDCEEHISFFAPFFPLRKKKEKK